MDPKRKSTITTTVLQLLRGGCFSCVKDSDESPKDCVAGPGGLISGHGGRRTVRGENIYRNLVGCISI